MTADELKELVASLAVLQEETSKKMQETSAQMNFARRGILPRFIRL